MRRDHEDLLRRLALNDEAAIRWVLGAGFAGVEGGTLDAKTDALARLAALIAVGSAEASYEWGASAALAVGASDEEIVGVLVAVTPIVGLARASAAAVALGLALDLEIVSGRL
jgi:4-carboxymuconolactone decarboxylase